MADTIDRGGMAPGPPGRVPGEDCRINALPDGLLLHAISFLGARQAVQTCVLSRRWRHLWRSVDRINATRHEFDGMADSEEKRDFLFKKFTNRFLMLRNPVPLDEFQLSYYMPDQEVSVDPDADSIDANLWIRHALQSNARSVEVKIWADRLHLDPAMFASKCFLTSLQLSCVILFHGFFRNLQTGCPSLEHLLLSYCAIDDVEISSQTLKVLTIGDSSDFTSDEQPCIYIPSLSYLGFSASAARLPLLKDMGSLVTASVSVDSGDTVADIRRFLRSLSGVTNLEFNYSGKMLKMEKNSKWCPKFNNLTALTLGEWRLSEDYYSLKVFLQNCPNLVKLTLKPKKCYYTSETNIAELEEGSFTCRHIEMLEIVCSEGGPNPNVLEKLLVKGGITFGRVRFRQTDKNQN
ncbi:unnamed protein product [Urochloa decumbens]|uniref:F-box domain-containing protein n=1 Tax=Urochloa decumbens TaxID=240449 RepID=A0ABC8WWI3_9POAL